VTVVRTRNLVVAIAGMFVVALAVTWILTLPGQTRAIDSVEVAVPAPAAPIPNVPEQSAEPTIDADAVWVARIATATGVPALALGAYARATIVTAATDPQCNLGWNTLAALGWAESAHGTVGGGILDDSGVVAPPIVGPALDGRRFNAIRDTDAGLLDGDATWDRAVGPLQFLPDTWARYGADGDGDGIADPQNIYDASLAAASYLCAVAGDVSSANAWTAAVAAYNPNDEYVGRVRERAIEYARLGG
jgi:membrane-bound lytic murein transglycosylase B